jgi:pilus assembly protein TadC
MIGGWLGLVTGVVGAGLLLHWMGTLEPGHVRTRRLRLAAELPLAVDLLAACLAAGGTVEEAAIAVADALEGPIGHELRSTAAAVLLGADPALAWGGLACVPELAPLARVMRRALVSGAPLAAAMTVLADEQRVRRRWAAEAAARRVGVRAVVPLGICFLPAFVLVGVVPVVVGIAGQLAVGWI